MPWQGLAWGWLGGTHYQVLKLWRHPWGGWPGV